MLILTTVKAYLIQFGPIPDIRPCALDQMLCI